jgi:CheY-like chemotaxis protein
MAGYLDDPDLDLHSENHKILLADDRPMIVQLASSWLEGAGYAVVTTTRLQEVLEKARDHRVGMIILDIDWCGRYEGCAMVEKLRSDPHLRDIPIILMAPKSADAAALPYCKSLPTGSVCYLYKPFNANQLLFKVENYDSLDPDQHDLSTRGTHSRSQDYQARGPRICRQHPEQ